MTLPELKRRGYPDHMVVGTLAGASTLGLLIPPSIIMIVYGVAAEVSIARLFIAGVIPGLVLGLLFCWNIGAIQHFLEGLLGVQLFNAEVYMLDSVPAKVDPWDVTWVAVFSFFMSCLASLPPSWTASRIDPVEALRYE